MSVLACLRNIVQRHCSRKYRYNAMQSKPHHSDKTLKFGLHRSTPPPQKFAPKVTHLLLIWASDTFGQTDTDSAMVTLESISLKETTIALSNGTIPSLTPTTSPSAKIGVPKETSDVDVDVCRFTGDISVLCTPRWTACVICCGTSGNTSLTSAVSCFQLTAIVNWSRFCDCTTAPTTSKAVLHGLSWTCMKHDQSTYTNGGGSHGQNITQCQFGEFVL